MADDELDDADLNDVGVQGGDLPSFSSGGGLPSFSGGSASTFKPRPPAVSGSPGVGEAGSSNKSPGETSKKKKRDEIDDVDSPAPDSSASATPSKPKKKKSKSAAEKKQSEKNDSVATTKTQGKGKEAASDKDIDDIGEERKDGEGGDAKREEEGEQSDVEGEDEVDEDEDEKYKDFHRRLEKELIGTCTEEEWTRYEAMRQSKFSMQAIKLLVSQVSDIPVGQIAQPLAFTIAGVAKVLVGELIDNARLVRQERGDNQNEPLQPRHIQEAYRLSLQRGLIPECRASKKPLFRR